jgi:cell division protein FtsI (penicillin-binding protein 3)
MTAVDRRIGILFVAFLGLLALALTRATELGTVKAASLRRAARTQQVQTITIPGARGTITDRDGAVLATSEAADDVIADPFLIRTGNPAAVARKLAPLLSQPEPTVAAKVTKPHTGFVYLAHMLPATQAQAISSLKINGITLIPQTKRVYPRGALASQVIGVVHSDGQGASGLELGYNRLLQGTDGIRRVVDDALGQPISIDEDRAARTGRSIQLTLDAELQAEVEQVLAGVGQTYQPKGATAIVMNPNTDQILALANWPTANLNNPASATPGALEDQAVGFNYEPGSTFKAITVAGALQDRLITPSTMFDIPPELPVGDGTMIHDAESHGYENLSVADILKVSSNIGADEIGARLGPQRFDRWVHRFGFGSPTGVDLPGEDRGIVLHWWQYSGATMFNLPFGQGESVTPIQMMAAYSAIANGGILRPPRIVKAIGGKPVPEPRGHRIISSTVASELRDMLRGVLADGGTASGAAIPGYDLGGKTGTANIAVNGQYSSSAFVASFIGFVPASHPSLVVEVVVDQPHGSIYGGSVAAPAFQKIVGWAVPYFGINPR